MSNRKRAEALVDAAQDAAFNHGVSSTVNEFQRRLNRTNLSPVFVYDLCELVRESVRRKEFPNAD